MGYLQRLLQYRKICIQCHNDPDADAIASAFGVYRYLRSRGADCFIAYGGPHQIKKSGLRMLIGECGIPVAYRHDAGAADLLLLVDCQYGQSNVEKFSAPAVAVIDHHIRVMEDGEHCLIDSSRQSCSTIIYELLLEEGYPVGEDDRLAVALLYGLYIDTACFADLFAPSGVAMKQALFASQPLFERLSKSNLSVAELLVASDAMYNHYFDVERRFAVVSALKCEQAVLGIIGDMVIQVDAVWLSLAYTEAGAGYQISLRSCHEKLPANEIAAYVCDGIGGGGGHARKAGGRIVRSKMQEKYGEQSVFDVVNDRLCRYIDGQDGLL